MTKALAVSVIALLLVSGAPAAADVASPGAAAQTLDRIDDLALTAQGQTPRPAPGLSRTHRLPRASRHARTGRGQRRSTTSRSAHLPIVSGLRPSQSRLEMARATLPPRHVLLHHRIAPRAPALN
jgi:hypothetical protein